MSNPVDILTPNYVSEANFTTEREKYSGLGQKIYFDIWLKDYFKMYDGSYMERIGNP